MLSGVATSALPIAPAVLSFPVLAQRMVLLPEVVGGLAGVHADIQFEFYLSFNFRMRTRIISIITAQAGTGPSHPWLALLMAIGKNNPSAQPLAHFCFSLHAQS